MSLRVRGGRVVTEGGVIEADVVCSGGRILALEEPGTAETGTSTPAEGEEVYDATGQWVFPGFIDPHVHSREPGAAHKGDFQSATRGALSGGVTTIIEMPNAIPPVETVDAFHQRRAEHERNAWVDFGLWGLSTGEHNLDQLRGLVEAGACAVKLFWGYALHAETRALVYNTADVPADELLLPPDNGVVRRVFAEMAAAGGVLACHCEDRDVLAAAGEDLGHPISSYDDLLAARPAVAEAATIALGSTFAAETGCRFHVVHTASAAGIEQVRLARERGWPVTAETCPQYLTLTADDYERIGAGMKVYPPIRHREDQDALWQAVNDGVIVSVGSDHAPHTVEEKQQGFATAPAGNVGCETFGPLLVDAMVRGRTTPERLAEVVSTSTAKLYGLYPRKGTIRPGADADLTIVDPTATRIIRNADLFAKQKFTPWDGTELTGLPVAAVLRGELAMRDGDLVGERRGRFLAAQHRE